MKLMTYLPVVAGILLSLPGSAQQLHPSTSAPRPLTPHSIPLASGRSLTLNLPEDFAIDVALQGLRRVRFLARSPDDRIFVTDMYSLADNSKGAIYILEGWNETAHTLARKVAYLDHLRNPNNVVFYTDAAGQSWLYFATTDRLVRYKYAAGDHEPTSAPEVLATYPDYGLNYKYGGWHLTRTVAFANLHGQPKLYVAVGSSCNACNEQEDVRATLSVMDPGGKHAQIIARGLRNAVGLAVVPSIDGGALFATNMGADHLGDDAPEDTFFEVDNAQRLPGVGSNYGWPTCYFEGGVPHADARISEPKPDDHTVPAPPAGPAPAQFDCTKIPAVYTTFASHSSPLGLAWFGEDSSLLKDSFLVALHGASHLNIGTGYRVVRFSPESRRPEDFITGFLVKGKGKPVVAGRPCGILQTGPDSFLLTDDHDGVVYFVHPKSR
jgi:glucose/arabinose dehydrogenase